MDAWKRERDGLAFTEAERARIEAHLAAVPLAKERPAR